MPASSATSAPRHARPIGPSPRPRPPPPARPGGHRCSSPRASAPSPSARSRPARPGGSGAGRPRARRLRSCATGVDRRSPSVTRAAPRLASISARTSQRVRPARASIRAFGSTIRCSLCAAHTWRPRTGARPRPGAPERDPDWSQYGTSSPYRATTRPASRGGMAAATRAARSAHRTRPSCRAGVELLPRVAGEEAPPAGGRERTDAAPARPSGTRASRGRRSRRTAPTRRAASAGAGA